MLKAEIGNTTVYYTRGFELISRREGTIASYYVYDSGLSVRALTNETGAVTDTLVFDAFGNETGRTGTTDNPYGFQGEEQDATGLYYLRARYMDPATGTFTTMDTYGGSLSDPKSLHKYLFANSNPVMYTDPSVHFSKERLATTMGCQAIISAALYTLGFSLMSLIDNALGTSYSLNYSCEEMVKQMIIGALLGGLGYLICRIGLIETIIIQLAKLPFSKKMGSNVLLFSISFDLYFISICLREKYGDSIVGIWVADIVAGIAGNIGVDSLGGLICNTPSELPGEVTDVIENVPGVSYDISDVVNDSNNEDKLKVLDAYGNPFTGKLNGKEYYNGIELVDGFTLGYGVNGEQLPISVGFGG